MGIAAYNRGSAAIARHIAEGRRPAEFEMMDLLNALPKHENAGTPFGDIEFTFSHGGCWAQCPVTGFGFSYPTLYEAVRNWRVVVNGYRKGVWLATPAARN